MQRAAENLHRPTPIPSLESMGSRRASGTLSVSSIVEEEEVEEHDSATSLEKSSEEKTGRHAGKFSRLSPILSGKQVLPRRGSTSSDKGLDSALKHLQQRSSTSGPPSPAASDGSEGSGATFRSGSIDSLHRPTPIPQEAGSYSRPGSFSKRSRPLSATPTINEFEDGEEADVDVDGGVSRNGSLYRPTPIPTDLLSSSSSLGRSHSNRGATPTIREDDDAAAADEPDELDSSEHYYGARPASRPRSASPGVARVRAESEAARPAQSKAGSASSSPTRAEAGAIAFAPPGPQAAAPASPAFQPFVDSKDWERDIVGVARFLRMCPGLSRQIIGDLLGENNERCLRVLECFTASFDFSGLSFEAALREYLESFRLPGEAQKIYRILDAWSRQFFKQCPGFFKSADAVHVLAFSLVLLNTDHHKSQVKRKMTCAEFVANNKGVNAGGDFPTDFLEDLFRSIARRSIRIPAAGPPDALSPTNSLPEPIRTTHQMYKVEEEKVNSSCCMF